MTVFRTYLKVLNKNKALVILYTVILIFFSILNMQTNDTPTNFVAEKPDILIVNEDDSTKITDHFIAYMEEHTNIKQIDASETAQNDALFYRDINYIIYIPKQFGADFLAGKNPKIEIKSTGDYQASLAAMMLERYFRVANIYRGFVLEEETLLSLIDKTLQKEVHIEMTSQLDTDQLSKVSSFWNFANYSILAGCVFVICFMIASFKEEKISRRTIVSSMNYQKYNRQLLLSNGLFSFTLWLFYVGISLILMGSTMISIHGLLFIVNSFVFTVTALALALLIGNLVHHKEAMSGIVNVIALGSSFLCGAFVPMEFLPNFVLTIAHILPSYYYINNNNRIATLTTIDIDHLLPFIFNLGILIAFILLFTFITNVISKKIKR